MTISDDFRLSIIFKEANALVYAKNNRRRNLNRFKSILRRSVLPPTMSFHYLEKDSGVEHTKASWALRSMYEILEQQRTQ